MEKEAMIKVLRYKAEHIKAKIRPEFFAEVADMLEREPCEDTISRADAIRVASGYCHPSNIAKELEKLPPVTPIRPKGHWLSVHTGKPSHLKDGMAVESIKCSECGEWLTASDEYACNGNYCPNCGADMREVEG